ncbi:MAG: class I SAM-dependent methyltransferase [Balneolaceae bacterium]
MSAIAYDPVKNKFAKIIRRNRVLRRLFYFLLDLFFLRSWHVRRVIKNTADEMDKEGEWHLLDAGCGFGQYDRFLLSSFKEIRVHAVDVKEDYLEDCRFYFKKMIQNGSIDFEAVDLLNPSLQKQYDFIICIDVLEHIEEDQKVIQNLTEALKPGGFFLMHSPSQYSEEDDDEDESFVGEHARPGYSKADISGKLESAGLKPENIHYTYGFWGHKAWILSVKYPMISLNKIGMAAILPLLIYYPVIMPFCLLMNSADLFTKNVKGNGIYALARKPPKH